MASELELTKISVLGKTASLPPYPQAHTETNPIDIYRSHLTDTLCKLTSLPSETIYPALEWTQSLIKGDLILAVPRLRVKGAKPDELAKKWAAEFPHSDFIHRPHAAGSFLQFHFNQDTISSLIIPFIQSRGADYGLCPHIGKKEAQGQRKRAVIEFSSPNIAKEFHVGHLRSTIIGGFLSNLYSAAGWETIKMNYLGDWGRQYGLLAVGWNRFGSEEKFEENPIRHLYDIYVEINKLFKPEQEAYKAAVKNGDEALAAELESKGLLGEAKNYFKRMEDGDDDALSLWKRFRDISIEKYKRSYARLNIAFDVYSGESHVKRESMERAEALLREQGISKIDNGAVIVNFAEHGAPKLGIAIIRNRNGTTNYLTRDIGAAIERWDTYQFDEMLYVVMAEQEMHLKRLFKTLELIGYTELSKRLQHISYGKVLGMSSRAGDVTFLDEILDQTSGFMHDLMRENVEKYSQVEDPEKTAFNLGVSAAMIQDMAGKRINNYPYDLSRMTSFEGDTGPYLQYAHARLCSLNRKAGLTREVLTKADFTLLREKHAIDLVRLMAQYPDVVRNALKTLEPTTIVGYLFRLGHQLSSSYDVLRVVGAETPELTQARAALYDAARQVMHNGMKLLGLTPLERM